MIIGFKRIAFAVALAGVAYAAPVCVIGIPCGGSCISKLENCLMDNRVTTTAREYGPEDDVAPPKATKNIYYIRASEMPNYFKISRSEFSISSGGYELILFPESESALLDRNKVILNAPPVWYDATLFIPLKSVGLIGCTNNASSASSVLIVRCGDQPFTPEWKLWK